MQIKRWRFAEDFQAGQLSQAYLDSVVNVSSYQHPAIVGTAAIDPALTQVVTGATLYSGTLPADILSRVTTGTGWFALETVEATTGSTGSISFSTTAGQVLLDLAGILETGPGLYDVGASGLQAGRIHRGGIVTVSVDGVVETTVDLYQTATRITLYLDGQRHTLLVAGTGTYNRAIDPSTVAADPPMLAIEQVQFLYGTGTGNPHWTSEVLDSGSDDTLWHVAEWQQNISPAYVELDVGSTPDPIGDEPLWHFQVTSTFQVGTLEDGTALGTAGLATLPFPRGRYARLGILFPPAAVSPPWVRDVALYSWVPAADPLIMTKLGLGQDWTPDPLFTALLGALTCLAADERQAALDYWAALTPAGALDAPLRAYGLDLGYPQYTGEGPLSYRRRLLAAMSMSAEAGSPPFLQEQLGLLLGFDPATIGMTTPGGAYTYTVTIPPPVTLAAGMAGYPGLPGLSVAYAQQIVTAFITQVLNPVTNIPTIIFG